MRLVVSIAKDFRHGEIPLDDRIQQGYIGLLKAVEGFKPGVGKFSTYATPKIRHEIRRYLQDMTGMVRIPVCQQDGRYDMSEAAADFRDMLRLEAENANGDGGVLADVLGHDDAALTDVDFRAMLECLSTDEADVITRRYVLGETLAEIGEARGGVSRQRIDQIHKVALGKLKATLAPAA